MVHVLQRAFVETAALQFLNWIVIRNFAEFIQSSGRTPTAALNRVPKRKIKGSAIHACLAARDDLECLHTGGGPGAPRAPDPEFSRRLGRSQRARSLRS